MREFFITAEIFLSPGGEAGAGWRRNEMKALVKAKAEPGLGLQDVPESAVGPMDRPVKTPKPSICHRKMFETWHKMSRMIRASLAIAPVISHRYPFTKFAQSFATRLSGQSAKVVLDWTI